MLEARALVNCLTHENNLFGTLSCQRLTFYSTLNCTFSVFVVHFIEYCVDLAFPNFQDAKTLSKICTYVKHVPHF